MKTSKSFNNQISTEKFLRYALHIGSLKSFWNPKMQPYLSLYRNDFCVFSLNFSLILLKKAINLLSKIILSGKIIVFIGSPCGLEKEFALLCKTYGHIHFKVWEYGCLTNDEKFFSVTKKPALFFFFEPGVNKAILAEILTIDTPIMAFLNSNSSCHGIDYPIPLNTATWRGGLFGYNLFRYLFLYVSKS